MTIPFFSIITPTYNRAAFLPAMIKSIIVQTFKDWELLIVDDGSTDNTKNAIAAFSDPRIQYLYQTNSERSVARNNGVNHCSGKYICFLDSDDYYLNNHLQILYDAIKKSGFAKAVFITDVMRDENGKLREVPHEELRNHRNNVCYILCAKETVIPARLSIPTSILKELPFNPQLNVSEDAELLSRISIKYPFIQVPFNTVVYHLHNENTTNKANNPYASQLIALEKIFNNPELKPFIPRKIKNEKLSNCYYGIAQYYHYSAQYLNMVQWLAKSIALDPFSATTKAKIYLILKGWHKQNS